MVAPSFAAGGDRQGSQHLNFPRMQLETEQRALTYAYITVATLQHFVHALGPEGGLQHPRDRFRSLNVCFLCFDASDALLLFLLL